MHRKIFPFCIFSLLIIMALVSSLACSSNLENDVVGKWTIVKNEVLYNGKIRPGESAEPVGVVIEFLSDKTFISIPRFWDPGKWTVLSDGRIKIQNPVRVGFATIKGKQMTIEITPTPMIKHRLVLEKK